MLSVNVTVFFSPALDFLNDFDLENNLLRSISSSSSFSSTSSGDGFEVIFRSHGTPGLPGNIASCVGRPIECIEPQRHHAEEKWGFFRIWVGDNAGVALEHVSDKLVFTHEVYSDNVRREELEIEKHRSSSH